MDTNDTEQNFPGMPAIPGGAFRPDPASLTQISAVSGQLSAVSVADILQMFCQPGNFGCIIFRKDLLTGKLFVEDGNLVHAELGDRSGEDVAKEIMTWKKGKFYFKFGAKAPVQTFFKRWDILILEASQQFDELFGTENQPAG